MGGWFSKYVLSRPYYNQLPRSHYESRATEAKIDRELAGGGRLAQLRGCSELEVRVHSAKGSKIHTE